MEAVNSKVPFLCQYCPVVLYRSESCLEVSSVFMFTQSLDVPHSDSPHSAVEQEEKD